LAGQEGNSNRVRFALNISQDELLSYYEGTARAVMVKASDGRNIQFPANVLQQFVTRDGIQGVFEMEFDKDNKFVNIRRVGD